MLPRKTRSPARELGFLRPRSSRHCVQSWEVSHCSPPRWCGGDCQEEPQVWTLSASISLLNLSPPQYTGKSRSCWAVSQAFAGGKSHRNDNYPDTKSILETRRKTMVAVGELSWWWGETKIGTELGPTFLFLADWAERENFRKFHLFSIKYFQNDLIKDLSIY